MSDIGKTEDGRRRTERSRSAARPPAPSAFALDETDKMHRKDGSKTRHAKDETNPPVLRRLSSVVRPPSSEWWSQTGSNRRPHACKARALPTELWPRRKSEIGSRKSELEKTLSDFRFLISTLRMVGLGGLEPPTSRLSSARSNQLSYKPDSENGGRRTEDRKALSVLRRPLSVVRKERETKAARSRKPRPDWPL
jgi:hypothetical protein